MNDERWQHLFRDYGNSSFSELLRRDSPHLFPSPAAARPPVDHPAPPEAVPHGTTVLALRYRDGVIMAGDRQATAGYQVASRRIEKIFKADDLSGVGIAGAAGPAMEMAKLFQTELEHYEKVEGDNLSLDGKANKLGEMIRMNLQAAMMGLAVVLIDAADEDVGTGGPDLVRGIFPSVKTITRSGFGDVTDDEVKRVCETILADRAKTGNGG